MEFGVAEPLQVVCGVPEELAGFLVRELMSEVLREMPDDSGVGPGGAGVHEVRILVGQALHVHRVGEVHGGQAGFGLERAWSGVQGEVLSGLDQIAGQRARPLGEFGVLGDVVVEDHGGDPSDGGAAASNSRSAHPAAATLRTRFRPGRLWPVP